MHRPKYYFGENDLKEADMSDCVFCKIVTGEIPSSQVYEDDQVIAFRDINPAAPVHILIIPKSHIPSLNDLSDKDELLMGHLLTTAKKIAEQEGVAQSGYRLIINTGPDGRQEVFHIHLHLLGGHVMRHPMG
jgi:histidine triad (HIT) family protein